MTRPTSHATPPYHATPAHRATGTRPGLHRAHFLHTLHFLRLLPLTTGTTRPTSSTLPTHPTLPTITTTHNRYDQAYVEHFTGVRPLYLPTLAGYVTARYRGGGARKHGRPFLLWRSHPTLTPTLNPNPNPNSNPNPNPDPDPNPFVLWRSHHEMGRTLLAELGSAAPDVAIRSLDKAYPGGAGRGGYQFSDLARHPGARGGLPPTSPVRPPLLSAHLLARPPPLPAHLSSPPIACSTHRMLRIPHAPRTCDHCTVSPATVP